MFARLLGFFLFAFPQTVWACVDTSPKEGPFVLIAKSILIAISLALLICWIFVRLECSKKMKPKRVKALKGFVLFSAIPMFLLILFFVSEVGGYSELFSKDKGIKVLPNGVKVVAFCAE